MMHEGAPWERAIHDARALRQKIGNVHTPLLDKTLHDLLGVSSQDASNWTDLLRAKDGAICPQSVTAASRPCPRP